MTDIQIWTRATFHPAYRCGGWAFVRQAGGASGRVGGERDTTADRMALAGLVAALEDLPPGALTLNLGTPGLARRVRLIASGADLADDEVPASDLDLCARLVTLLKGRSISLIVGEPSGFVGDPVLFAQAWADLAQDKAKAGGAFSAIIPKPNLAKLKLG